MDLGKTNKTEALICSLFVYLVQTLSMNRVFRNY